MNLKNLILIPIILAILATTAWSVYRQDNKGIAAQAPKEPVVTVPAQNFFETLYRDRLKEEGNRTGKVEKLVKEGKLSDKPAQYFKEAKEPGNE